MMIDDLLLDIEHRGAKMSADPMALKRILTACVIVLGFAGHAGAQSIALESDNLAFAQVEAGPVELDLDVVVSSAFELDTIAVALTSNEPALFAYRDPVYTVGQPFFEQELLVNTLPDPDQPLSEPAIFTFFSVIQTFGPERFPATIVTIHLKSINDLVAGTYAFSFDPTLTRWGTDFQLTTFLATEPFTLTVTAPDSGDDGGNDDGNGDGDGDDDLVGPPVPGDDSGDDSGSDEDGTSDGEDDSSGENGGSGTGGVPSAPALCGIAAAQTLMVVLLSLAPLRSISRRRYRR
jgi:hypothetical protein